MGRLNRSSAPKFDKTTIVFDENLSEYELDTTPILNSETISTPSYELKEGVDYTLDGKTLVLDLDSDFCKLLITGTTIKAKWAYR